MVKTNGANILDFFNSQTDPESPRKMSDYVNTTENFKRANLLNEYLKIVDPSYFNHQEFDTTYDKCPKCYSEKTLVQTEGIMVCENCGLSDFIIIDSDRPSYKDPPPEVSYFAYKRINHFILIIEVNSGCPYSCSIGNRGKAQGCYYFYITFSSGLYEDT